MRRTLHSRSLSSHCSHTGCPHFCEDFSGRMAVSSTLYPIPWLIFFTALIVVQIELTHSCTCWLYPPLERKSRGASGFGHLVSCGIPRTRTCWLSDWDGETWADTGTLWQGECYQNKVRRLNNTGLWPKLCSSSPSLARSNIHARKQSCGQNRAGVVTGPATWATQMFWASNAHPANNGDLGMSV